MKKTFFNAETGAATLLITTIMMVSITMIALFAANYSLMQQKISGNNARNQQAFEAAEAGLEYGINYLNQNSAVILANPVNGYIQPFSNSSISNVTLANNSKFSIVYSNPIANNYKLIQITSTGTSDDGTATRVVKQQVAYGSLLYIIPPNPLILIQSTNLLNSASIINLEGNSTIKSGLSTVLSSGSTTVLSTGPSSTASYMGSDIQQNVTSLANMTPNNFFASYFGIGSSAAKNKAVYVYSNLGNYNSVLNGKSGTTIWIDQNSGSATINSTTQVGTIASPILLFINGTLDLQDQANITGFVVLLGSSSSNIGNQAQINGGLISQGTLNLSTNSFIKYNSTVLKTLQSVTNQYYAKVPGTWSDF